MVRWRGFTCVTVTLQIDTLARPVLILASSRLCAKILPVRNSLRVLICLLVTGLVTIPLPVGAQEPDPVAVWLTWVNQVRLDEGMAPYALSRRLTLAAQRHADDLATHGFTNADDVHVGSDGSTARQRIAELEYTAWTQDGGEPIVGESVWTGAIEDGMAFFLEEPIVRDNIFSTAFREIGIGAATHTDGRRYYVLTFGVHPNVVPIFINDGAVSTDSTQIAVTLTNETVRPEGQGANFIGQAIEIRISDEPDLDGLPWQLWEPLIPWTLPDTPGEHTVYVQFRDAAGRTAGSTDSIFLSETPVTPTPVLPSLISGLAAGATATLAPGDASGFEQLPTLEPLSTGSASEFPLLDVVATPFPTWTPLPTVTPHEETAGEHGDAPLALLLILQGLALLLGLFLFLQRGRRQ
jgi:hypothetical protein